MTLTFKELFTLTHGIVLGGLFLLAFTGVLSELYSFSKNAITSEEMSQRLSRLKIGTSIVTAAIWLTVILGIFVIYPWYRAAPPEGADLALYPRSYLKADPELTAWHSFGMEWKEHIALFAPILATAVTFLIFHYGPKLTSNNRLRHYVIYTFILAFLVSSIAGLMGALITKVAPLT